MTVLILHQHWTMSVNDKLQSLALLYDRQYPISMPVVELHDSIIDAMESSSHSYSCTATSQVSAHAHENMLLTLLALRNRGSPRPSDNRISLKDFPVTANLRLEDLLANRPNFANPALCIEDGKFVVHFGMKVCLSWACNKLTAFM